MQRNVMFDWVTLSAAKSILRTALFSLFILSLAGIHHAAAQGSFNPLSLTDETKEEIQNTKLGRPDDKIGPSVDPNPAVSEPRNVRFQPANNIALSQASELLLLWDPPTTPSSGGFIYHISVVTPLGKEMQIGDPTPTTVYQPFAQSEIILTGQYTFKIYAVVHGTGSSEIVEKTLTIHENEPTPTPILPVGEPYDVRLELRLPEGETQYIEDGGSVFLSDVDKLYLAWDQPTRPQGVQFKYDIELVTPYGQKEELDYLGNDYQLFPTGYTASGIGREFIVLISAEVDGVGSSYKLRRSFYVIADVTPTPTMTPLPVNPDISADDSSDMTDIMLFALSYKTGQDSNSFEPRADFVTDGNIDVYDLIYFTSIYKSKKTQSKDVPVWLYADVPVFEKGANEYDPCIQTTERFSITFPPNQITFGGGDEQDGIESACAYATFNKTEFYFSLVEGAVDYKIIVKRVENGEIINTLRLYERNYNESEDSFSYITVPGNSGEWFSFELQPVFADSGLGEISDPLLFRIMW